MAASSTSTVAGILARFPSAHVLVIGDLIVDRFVWGKVERISPEAPVPVVRVTEENLRLGGAANVAHNLRSLGARVSLAGVVGRDALGEWFRDELAASGVHRQAVVPDAARRTTEKTRVVAQHQQVVRFDREDPGVLPPPVAERLARAVSRRLAHADAVILSDYGKEVLSESLVREVIRGARARGVPVLVDPIVEATPRYRGATLVTPNLKEASGMAGMTIDDGVSLARAGRKLLKTLALEGALITRGEDGMTLFRRDRPPVHIPTTARDVFDVTGAGDTVIATLAVCEALGVERSLGARLSNAAAGIVVGKVGTATVTAEELQVRMRSMTGFGSASRSSADGRITVEVRGVNHRFLDVHLRLPREMAAAETPGRDAVRKRVRRGRVDVTVWWIPAADPTLDALDPARLRPLKEALERAARELGLDEPVTLDAVLRARDQGASWARPLDEDRCAALVRAPLAEALGRFVEMREREGSSLVADAFKLLAVLERHRARVVKLAPRIVADHGRKLARRVAELVGDASLDPARVAQEVAILADRIDVREETTRLESHMEQAHGILSAGREGGRKLDFLVQEMLREVNTIGSKLSGGAATREVVSMKAAIEKLREQIQNLE